MVVSKIKEVNFLEAKEFLFCDDELAKVLAPEISICVRLQKR